MGPSRSPLKLFFSDKDQEYEIKRLVTHNKTRFRILCQVRWWGYDAIEESWLREVDLANASDLLQAYQLRHGI